jgi:hypothetical protein
MRVEIQDGDGQGYTITSGDPALVGQWFAEHSAHLMSADARYQARMQIWPSTAFEYEILSSPRRLQALDSKFTQDSLLALAQHILDASARLGELEAAAADG